MKILKIAGIALLAAVAVVVTLIIINQIIL